MKCDLFEIRKMRLMSGGDGMRQKGESSSV